MLQSIPEYNSAQNMAGKIEQHDTNPELEQII